MPSACYSPLGGYPLPFGLPLRPAIGSFCSKLTTIFDSCMFACFHCNCSLTLFLANGPLAQMHLYIPQTVFFYIFLLLSLCDRGLLWSRVVLPAHDSPTTALPISKRERRHPNPVSAYTFQLIATTMRGPKVVWNKGQERWGKFSPLWQGLCAAFDNLDER